ncbi:MAG: thioredoxin family protein [Phycisphaerales bacterium]
MMRGLMVRTNETHDVGIIAGVAPPRDRGRVRRSNPLGVAVAVLVGSAVFTMGGDRAVAATTTKATTARVVMAAPPIFQELTFAAAIDANRTDGKLLIVDGTADWCQPCKLMDRTTWSARDVDAWIRARGTAIQLDVDRWPDVAATLEINVLPQVVVFRRGQEVGRTVGYKQPAELLTWLGEVEAVDPSNRAADPLDVRMAEVRRAEPPRVRDRLKLAQQLLWERRAADAAVDLLYLWDAGADGSPVAARLSAADAAWLSAVRGRGLIDQLGRCVRDHPPLAAELVQRRDAASFRLAEPGVPRVVVTDWANLSRLTGQESSVLRWFESRRGDLAFADSVAPLSEWIFDLHLRQRDFAAAGRVFDAPVQNVERALESAERQALAAERETRAFFAEGRAQPAGQPVVSLPTAIATARRAILRSLHDRVAQVHTSLLAAGRDDEAAAVRARLLAGDDSIPPRLAMVDSMVSAGVGGTGGRLVEALLAEAASQLAVARAATRGTLPAGAADAASVVRGAIGPAGEDLASVAGAIERTRRRLEQATGPARPGG